MALLTGLRVAQFGPGVAAAVSGRLFADLGADVVCVGGDRRSYLNDGKTHVTAAPDADLVICQEWSGDVSAAPVVTISPFGQTGPKANDPATDLTLLYASGISRLLTGQVDDLSEPPIRPVGEQSAFIAGLAAACAGMHAVFAPGSGVAIDVSMQEALATLAMTELTRAGLTGRSASRERVSDGNGATVCILPARDGYAAISPREDKQWTSWLAVMGSPPWGAEPRFAAKADRVAHWDELHALMSEWSRGQTKQQIADVAQAAHVPGFPLRDLAEHFQSEQLRHRGFWRTTSEGKMSPAAPFGLTLPEGVPKSWPPGKLPLSGVRVLDFSWVIAGPTATRYLAAMGAEVIKVEAPGRGDPGRATELHTVLGQAKKAIVLDLKRPEHREAARALAKTCDVLVENFATGVMDRLGLGADAMHAVNPDLIYVSASGLGRTGPEANAVAYGTLLQCYAGFAGLNRHPNVAPRVGFAWLDPMLGLMLAFATAASLWRRRQTGHVARIDCSMIEAILWTLSGPLLAAQSGSPPQPMGNRSEIESPHGAWSTLGGDAWLSIAVRNDTEWRALCGVVPGLMDRFAAETGTILAAWCQNQDAREAERVLRKAGVPASALASSIDLVTDAHLRARGFWDQHEQGVLPGLPWRASFGRATGPAPALGADTDAVLRGV